MRRHAAWLLVALAYVYVFPYFERVNNPNENARVWMTRAIVEYGQLNIGRVQSEWGYVNDKVVSGPLVFSGKAPGTSLLGVPVLFAHTKLWHLFGWPSPSKLSTTFSLRLFSVALPLCAFLLFFARYLERRGASRSTRDLMVVGLGLGTLIYPYGVVFVGHAQAAALAFCGYVLLSDRPGGEPPSRARLEWAGVLAGLSVLFEYQAVFGVFILGVYALVVHRRRGLLFVAGGVFPALLVGGYNRILFGSPFEFVLGHLENPAFASQQNVGFFGQTGPKLGALGVILFSPSYGLLAFSPLLALGIVGAVVMVVTRPRADGVVILAVFAVMAAILSGMINFRAGWCVGPRYITLVAPFLVAGAAHLGIAMEKRPAMGDVFAAVAGGLVLASVVVTGVSGALFPHYPEQFDNPVFDLAFPLLGDGFAPYGIGRLLHLPGAWSLAPLGVAVLAAVALGLSAREAPAAGAGVRSSLLRTVGAVLVAAAFLVPLGRHERAPDPDEKRAADFVRAIWQPKGDAVAVAPAVPVRPPAAPPPKNVVKPLPPAPGPAKANPRAAGGTARIGGGDSLTH